MELFKLIVRNTFRQRLRTGLTVVGMAVAILAFCLLRTLVDAWYAGASAASPNRLVTRNAASLIFTMPISYRDKILQVPGVEEVVYANWFAGIYIDEKHFFPRMAVGPRTFFELYPEFVIPPDRLEAFWNRRNSCIAGRKLAEKYRWKIGDTIPITGNIYPGEWRFVLQGIYTGATRRTDETQFFFRWDYLDEMVKKSMPPIAGQVGWYIVGVRNPAQSATVSQAVDKLFANSPAETLTETEKAFQLGFVAMTEAIVVAIRVVSFVVIGVILVILANTMAMTSRERMPEYATLKTLGFGNRFLAALIAGESVSISILGGTLGIVLTFPIARIFAREMAMLLPIFHVGWQTILMGIGISLSIGLLSAVFPAWRAMRAGIAEALGHVG
ncbi:MAG: ABC transporter permease [Desulfobacteraceae bacterium]|nr:ABC transporter permease [Desulfobacteraceae bacterium]